jgi:hydrogenase nickel incorporation protein HypB
MSSPGAGKTTVLGATLTHLRERGLRAGVVEGDIETSIDADRLRGLADQVSLLNTGNGFGGECHLDAPMVARALQGLDLGALDVVLVENVGNLVCPAEFDVGAHRRVMVCSVTEGEDKPLKYPVMFRSVDAVLVNKTDLLPYLDLDIEPVAAELTCRSCGATTVLADRFLIACTTCDGADVEVVHGEELVVASLDLAEPASSVGS